MEGMRTAGKILGEYLDKSKCITYIENTGSGVEIDSASAKIVLSDDTIIGICKMRDLKVP